jgi:hypothetical protein
MLVEPGAYVRCVLRDHGAPSPGAHTADTDGKDMSAPEVSEFVLHHTLRHARAKAAAANSSTPAQTGAYDRSH